MGVVIVVVVVVEGEVVFALAALWGFHCWGLSTHQFGATLLPFGHHNNGFFLWPSASSWRLVGQKTKLQGVWAACMGWQWLSKRRMLPGAASCLWVWCHVDKTASPTDVQAMVWFAVGQGDTHSRWSCGATDGCPNGMKLTWWWVLLHGGMDGQCGRALRLDWCSVDPCLSRRRWDDDDMTTGNGCNLRLASSG